MKKLSSYDNLQERERERAAAMASSSLFLFTVLLTSLAFPSSSSDLRIPAILGDSPLVHRFVDFADRFGKRYSTVEELRHRFSAFADNLEIIESTNRKNAPYTLGVNKFTDVTWYEFKETYLRSSQQNCSATKGTHKLRSVDLPARKDWRKQGIVSDVKSQGHCGSCWTFSTTGALEAAHAQATGKMVLLSEQQLIDCAGEYNNFGCNGGLPSQAFEYIRFNGGLDTEEAYPYKGEDSECKFTADSVGAQVYEVVNITMGAEDELQEAVGLARPVSVAFEVIRGFHLYESGVFTSADCSVSPEDVNHAVLAVGYDVDDDGTAYWIIKNSWGDNWGENGYFKMEMGSNMCGIATCASYPVVPEELELIRES